MVCVFCAAHLDTIDECIEAGWWPDFLDAAGVCYEGPVCLACTRHHLAMGVHGEMELAAGVPVPPLAIPLRHRRND